MDEQSPVKLMPLQLSAMREHHFKQLDNYSLDSLGLD